MFKCSLDQPLPSVRATRESTFSWDGGLNQLSVEFKTFEALESKFFTRDVRRILWKLWKCQSFIVQFLSSRGLPTQWWPLGKTMRLMIYLNLANSRDTIDKETASLVPGLVQDVLYLTAVLNTCINPLVYGLYYHSDNCSRSANNELITRYTSSNQMPLLSSKMVSR